MRQKPRANAFENFLWGEIVLVTLLGAALAIFLSESSLRAPYDLPQLRLIRLWRRALISARLC